MATRKIILGIVAGINGKLKSRNNDISGEPGAGIIYAYTKAYGARKCCFDLLSGESKPSLGFEWQFAEVYRSYIHCQLNKNKLPDAAVSRAQIEYNFDLASCDWTNIYNCKVTLASDTGKVYSMEHYGTYSEYIERIEGGPVVRPFSNS